MRHSCLALAFVFSSLLAASIRADDWPQWRGPARDGTWAEKNLPEAFPADGLKVRWRTPIGWGWSSPVVSQGRVFVTDSQIAQPKAQEQVCCFDEATGKPLWTHSYEVVYPDWVFVSGQESGPSATPIVEAGSVYTLGGNGHAHCLDIVDGKPIWQKDLGKEYKIEPLMCRASPLIEGNLLILFTGAKPGACVLALDKTTGNEVWKALDESVTNSSPIVIEAGGVRQLIVWTQESVTSLNPLTGERYWRERLATSNNDAVSSPVVDKNLLLVGGLMFELAAGQPAAKVRWPASKAVSRRVLSNTSTALLGGGYVFSAKSAGELVCLEASTGQPVWETDKVTDLKGGASIHLTVSGESVLLFNDKGELIRARLSTAGYEEISRARLLEPTYTFAGRKVAWTPPAFANRQVFARSDKELICASLGAQQAGP